MFVVESAIELKPPRSEFAGMRAVALVMGTESLLKVLGKTDIGLRGIAFASENVNVIHARASRLTPACVKRAVRVESGPATRSL